MMYIVGNDDEEQVKLLLSHGAAVNAQSPYGLTPLMVAVRARASKSIIMALLEAEADPALKDSQGMTALDMARQVEYADAVLVLQEKVAPRPE